ncbi:hypothetical protein MKW98_012327 [Papaver atlanticum]|uniref:Uncharacterized protein n=1 Tax=Papaver atlanticum TaxID=357466 RepID=A0AAD4SZI5_9MAGN|nr:hypothetical protein MKW98_012327 [Papaver atlanticum]
MLLKGFPDQCDALKSLKNGVLEEGLLPGGLTNGKSTPSHLYMRLLPRVASDYTVTKGPFLDLKFELHYPIRTQLLDCGNVVGNSQEESLASQSAIHCLVICAQQTVI